MNVEELLSFLNEQDYKVSVDGKHKRNAYNDIIELEELDSGSLVVHVGRDSLYNSLPEYMFHVTDRFDNLSANKERESFIQECQKQTEEQRKAQMFFAPFDWALLGLRVGIRRKVCGLVDENKVIIKILADDLSEEYSANKYVRKTLPFLPSCKYVRGSVTLLTFVLRKVLSNEGLRIVLQNQMGEYCDEKPRYGEHIGADLSDMYVGNMYEENVLVYKVHYWPEDECDEHFPAFLHDLEVYRQFVEDYFVSVEAKISFDLVSDAPTLRISDVLVHNYLNYNTNL